METLACNPRTQEAKAGVQWVDGCMNEMDDKLKRHILYHNLARMININVKTGKKKRNYKYQKRRNSLDPKKAEINRIKKEVI